jgi:hypothetical protein
VARIEALAGWKDRILWVVPKGQAADYRFQGATTCIEVRGSRPNICGSRNAVLDIAFQQNRPAVVFLDDDTKNLRYVYEYEGTHAKQEKVTVAFAVEHLLRCMDEHPNAKLGGIGPTANWLYVCGGERIKTRAFIQSNFALVKRTHLRYDSDLELSEDYDYCIQHLETYGSIVRDDLILGDYQKRTNAGGLQSLANREAADIASRARLHRRWPEYVTWPHPKAGTREVLVKWKKVGRSEL